MNDELRVTASLIKFVREESGLSPQRAAQLMEFEPKSKYQPFSLQDQWLRLESGTTEMTQDGFDEFLLRSERYETGLAAYLGRLK